MGNLRDVTQIFSRISLPGLFRCCCCSDASIPWRNTHVITMISPRFDCNVSCISCILILNKSFATDHVFRTDLLIECQGEDELRCAGWMRLHKNTMQASSCIEAPSLTQRTNDMTVSQRIVCTLESLLKHHQMKSYASYNISMYVFVFISVGVYVYAGFYEVISATVLFTRELIKYLSIRYLLGTITHSKMSSRLIFILS